MLISGLAAGDLYGAVEQPRRYGAAFCSDLRTYAVLGRESGILPDGSGAPAEFPTVPRGPNACASI